MPGFCKSFIRPIGQSVEGTHLESDWFDYRRRHNYIFILSFSLNINHDHTLDQYPVSANFGNERINHQAIVKIKVSKDVRNIKPGNMIRFRDIGLDIRAHAIPYWTGPGI